MPRGIRGMDDFSNNKTLRRRGVVERFNSLLGEMAQG